MNRIDIAYLLKKRGYTLSAVARVAGVTPSTVSDVLNDRKSRRVAMIIARLTDIPVSRLFPDGRYAASSTRKAA